ncbi:hypothetical protein AVEN_45128-1 [Araneus ventricosus]|uniref:Uncharacterized protein n=1 Tax=Araneus ventricosus TaxID=182803 RepID=A0A4Y2GT15_ARAVE|nr:hypothetical protein AVEN_45128-1 [Araneus ventricosus]
MSANSSQQSQSRTTLPQNSQSDFHLRCRMEQKCSGTIKSSNSPRQIIFFSPTVSCVVPVQADESPESPAIKLRAISSEMYSSPSPEFSVVSTTTAKKSPQRRFVIIKVQSVRQKCRRCSSSVKINHRISPTPSTKCIFQ